MTDRLVSIIISTHNNIKRLSETIASIQEHTSGDYEIIVVADACDDGTQETLRRHHPEVHVIEAPDIGWGGSNNRGFTIASGNYLFFSGSDCQFYDGWLEALISVYEMVPDCGVVAPLTRKGSLVLGGGYVGALRGLLWGDPQVTATSPRIEVDFVWYPLVRRDRFEFIGGFDDGYFISLDEDDLGFRLRKAGYRNYIVTGAHMSTDPNPGGTKVTYFWSRSQFRFLVKHNSGLLLPGLLIVFWSKEIARICASLAAGRADHALAMARANTWSLRNLARILRSRKSDSHLNVQEQLTAGPM